MRLIDADDLPISSIDMTDVGYYVSKYGQGIPAVYLEDIKDAPTIEPQESRWIRYSEDPPKEYGDYLVTEMPIGDFEIEPYVATYDPEDDEWTTGSPCRIVRRPVIAWMPLPEPYREETG